MLTSKQGRDVNSLVKRECANYFDGDCLILDCNCPQLISGDLLCNYFIEAVLPLDVVLEQELTGNGFKKACKECGKKFATKSKTGQYCGRCVQIVARKKDRERKKRALG